MDIVILDLEWNGTYSRRLKGYINEIIEFGAVKCGPDLSEKATFSCFVKPQVAKHISSTISTLTSITDETLTGGATFMQAVSRFKRWAGDCVVMTWGTSDILTLIENCRYFSGDEHVPFLSRYCDLQVFAQDRMGLGRREQVGLSKAASCWAGRLRHGPPPGAGRQPHDLGHFAQGVRQPGHRPLYRPLRRGVLPPGHL